MTNYLDKDGLKKFWDITKGKYSAIGHNHDDRYLKLTGGALSGRLTANGGITIPYNNSIIQNQAASANYTTAVQWKKGGVDQATYNPQIGQLNTEMAITILPYPIDDAPWNGKYGLFIKKGVAKIDGVELSKVTHNHDSKYLSLSGGTLTGGLTTNGTFHSVGASTLDSTLTVGGAATLNSSLTVKGATTVQGLTVNDNISVKNGKYLSALNSGNSHYAKYTSDGIQFTTKLNDTAKTLAFPSKGGTIALDVDLAKYLPLSGGTISGVLMVNGAVTMQTTLKVTGNVGIGTDADAAYKLKVNGTAYFSGDATVNGNLQVAGEIHNGNFYTDVEGRIYTTSLALIYGSNIRTWDDNGKERNFNLQKAIELGVFS